MASSGHAERHMIIEQMTLKMKSNYIGIITACIIVLTIFYLVGRDKDVVLLSSNWSCEYKNDKWECRVSLEIENETRTHQNRNISIRGVRIPADSKTSSLKIYGEKILKIEMAPHERVVIIETVEMRRKPNKVNIKVWK